MYGIFFLNFSGWYSESLEVFVCLYVVVVVVCCCCCAVMGLAFIPLGSSGIYIHAIKFQLSMLTAPGYIGAVLGIVNFIVLIFFREYKLESREIKRKRLKEEALKKKEETLRKQTMKESRLLGFAVDTPKKHYDRLGAMAAIVLFFVVMSGFSVFET